MARADIEATSDLLERALKLSGLVAALNDPAFEWAEAERLADSSDFKVLGRLMALKKEIADARA